MSAPETNLEKQKKWHRGPLAGIALALVFVVVLTVAFVLGSAEQAPEVRLDGAEPEAAGEMQQDSPATGG